MRRVIPLFTWMGIPARLVRALRYYTRLHYTWHLAWVKADRKSS